MSDDRYAPARLGYVSSGRMGYYAVDEIKHPNDGSPAHPTRDPVFAGTRKDAEQVAGACNAAFESGKAYGRYQVQQEAKCEGYSNYETFAVAQWITRSENRLKRLFSVAAKKYGAKTNPCEEGLAAYCDWLREYTEGWQPDFMPPFSELINHALSSVDWYELAQELYEEAKKS